jgi:hypothetical protein
MPCLSLLIAITTRMDASSPTDAYRHPARPTTTDTASTSPLFRLPTFPPCPLFQNPHDVALDVAVESLPLLRRPAVSFTRSHHVSECGAQTGLTTTPATPTPTRRQDKTGPIRSIPRPLVQPPISNYIPETASINQHPLHVAFVCPRVSVPLSHAPLHVLVRHLACSRFHHVIASHPSNLDSNLDSTHNAHPPAYSQDARLLVPPLLSPGVCSCSHISPSLQRRLVKKYSSPIYPPSRLPFASPLCSFVKSPPSPPQPSESHQSPALLLHIITRQHPLLHR